MERKELIKILRADYTNKVRPLLIKDKCEICGTDEELELHHRTQFTLLVDKSIEDLHIVINIMGEEELEKIRNYMLGLQLTNDNITLCKNCHREGHKLNEESNRIRKEKQSIGVMKRQLKKEYERKIYEETVIKPYLESITDKRLTKEEQNELIETLDLRDNRNRLQKKVSTLNAYLNDNFNMQVTRGVDKRRRLKNGEDNPNRDKRYWIIRYNK